MNLSNRGGNIEKQKTPLANFIKSFQHKFCPVLDKFLKQISVSLHNLKPFSLCTLLFSSSTGAQRYFFNKQYLRTITHSSGPKLFGTNKLPALKLLLKVNQQLRSTSKVPTTLNYKCRAMIKVDDSLKQTNLH